jgi:hypothetical protein
MDTHVKFVGIANIVFGVLSACLVAATLIYYGGIDELYATAQADFVVAAFSVSILFHAIVSVPCIILGLRTMRYQQSARSVLTVVSALNLLNVPVGSVIGGYGLWVLLSEETEPLFAEPPPNRKARMRPPSMAANPVEQALKKVKSASVLRSRRAGAGQQ